MASWSRQKTRRSRYLQVMPDLSKETITGSEEPSETVALGEEATSDADEEESPEAS